MSELVCAASVNPPTAAPLWTYDREQARPQVVSRDRHRLIQFFFGQPTGGRRWTRAVKSGIIVRRDGRLRGQAAEDAGGREHEAEAASGRRPLGKEVVTPAGRRKAVVDLREAFGMSERRACKDRLLRQRMRAIAKERPASAISGYMYCSGGRGISTT